MVGGCWEVTFVTPPPDKTPVFSQNLRNKCNWKTDKTRKSTKKMQRNQNIKVFFPIYRYKPKFCRPNNKNDDNFVNFLPLNRIELKEFGKEATK